jgi:hypothetical protein
MHLLAYSSASPGSMRGKEVNIMGTELTYNELEFESAELLPARETLFFNTYNWAGIYASNSSLAVNAATLLSQANSAAVQNIAVSQH